MIYNEHVLLIQKKNLAILFMEDGRVPHYKMNFPRMLPIWIY